MEGLQNLVSSFSKDPNSGSPSILKDLPYNLLDGRGEAVTSSDSAYVLVNRTARQFVSLWTCSKLCGICFAAGIIVGYTLKRRVRRWASRLLKRLRDDE
ncbi:respiratory burst oxidase-like protein E-like isoform X1 [Hibiscus syriacus]|uniref:Respiratory burst oxidase-like protein E-like isoform X1 n=1 Tax=Hibiscus syriacus TaxID=106335 RepID=A0A6A2Z7V9_HIBSY|nr:respiratory burst oxidase-like protein E-like isoform X1 [Hibiscus syriacus]